MYKILAIVGKSASGKDTILKEVVRQVDCCEIVSHTTRPIRDNERNGKNYHFVSKREFLDLLQNDKMLEYAIFNGWYYGTSYNELSEDKINVGVFNLQGIKNMIERENDIELAMIVITADQEERLRRSRLRVSDPDSAEIERRLKTDDEDFKELSSIVEQFDNTKQVYLGEYLNNTLYQKADCIHAINQYIEDAALDKTR